MKQDNEITVSQLIEALLFLENRPVNISYITKVLGITKDTVYESVEELNVRFGKFGSSLIITKNSSGDFHLSINSTLYTHLGKHYDIRKKMHLSPQALETLAIIAYKQPVTRVEIEKIRGVQINHILRVLLDYGHIKIVGKKDVLGRPVLYGTTDKFLKYFGLLSIKDLPPITEFEKH